MTKLFEEYETQRLVKSLIGKKFYWSKNFVNGKTFGRKLENEFMIVNYHMGNKTYEDVIIYYEYLMDGLQAIVQFQP